MNHEFRARLKAGQLLIGTMITLDSAVIAELLTLAGFDWLFVDGEHSPITTPGIQRILQGAGSGMPCLVRVSESAEVPIKNALDAGAAGIIAPMVNSVQIAESVVRWAKYSPMGTRGVGLARAHGYGLNIQDYLQNANEETAVIIQVEHIDGVNNIKEIVQVTGIDAVFIGPFDLSASLGRLGEVTHPEVTAAIDHVTAVCRAANMPLACFGVSAEAVKPFIERGYTLITVGIDTMLLGQAAKTILADLR